LGFEREGKSVEEKKTGEKKNRKHWRGELAGESKLRHKEPAAWMPRAMGGELGDVTVDFVRFEYPESTSAPFVPTWEGWDDPAAAPSAGGAGTQDSVSTSSGGEDGRATGPENGSEDGSVNGLQHSVSADADSGSPEMARLLGEERERAFETGFEAGRRQGIEEGREAAREAERDAGAQAEQRRIAQVAAVLERFASERDCYLKAMEGEVVKLALAIAARILRREAEVDPLLLSGAVRVALGQIAASTEVRLRVPAAELAMWKEAMAAVPNLRARPTVVAGEGMQLGDCAIETALGTADLGIGAQLGEIERVLVKEPAAVGTTVSKVPNQEKRLRESAA
jgi:flagellar biosynthesis/type III secretory pathway protein FliH